MNSIDRWVFDSINGGPDFWSPLFVFLSEGNKWLGVRLGFLVLLVYLLVRNRQTRLAALVAIAAVGLSNELTDWIKATYPTLRPSAELTEIQLRTGRLTSFGTASAHSANMAALFAVFARLLGWRWGLVWGTVAFLTGMSRIYVGVHYPYQVLLGWTCGIAVALVLCEASLAIRARVWPELRNPDAPAADQPTPSVPASPPADHPPRTERS